VHTEKALLANLVRLELLDHVVQESIVKVFASQEGITIGGLHLEHTTCRRHSCQAHTIKRGKLDCHSSIVAAPHSLQMLSGNDL